MEEPSESQGGEGQTILEDEGVPSQSKIWANKETDGGEVVTEKEEFREQKDTETNKAEDTSGEEQTARV